MLGGWDRWKRGEISIGERRISRGGRSIDRLIDLSGTMGLRGQRWIFALMNFIPRIISNTDLKWIQDNDVYEVLGWLALGLLSILVRLIAKSCARFFSNPRVFAGNPSGRNFNSPWNFKIVLSLYMYIYSVRTLWKITRINSSRYKCCCEFSILVPRFRNCY